MFSHRPNKENLFCALAVEIAIWLFVIFAIERFMLVSLYFILLLNDTYTRHVDLILLLLLVPTGPVFYFGSVA